MANKVKITKEKVLECALELVRNKKEPSARNIARALNCSTQPIYSIFGGMDELISAFLEYAQDYQNKKIREYAEKMPEYKAQGMAYVKFAKEERNLYRFLYLTKPSTVTADRVEQDNQEITNTISKTYNFKRDKAKKIHDMMSVFTFGLAVLQSRGEEFREEDISDMLSTQFLSLNSYLEDKHE